LAHRRAVRERSRTRAEPGICASVWAPRTPERLVRAATLSAEKAAERATAEFADVEADDERELLKAAAKSKRAEAGPSQDAH
jgi:hypothetical protein